MLLDWGAAVDKVWGTSPYHGPDSPPSSNRASNTFTTPEHSAPSLADDPQATFVDLLDVKDEDSGVVMHRKRRKSKSPKFTVSISLRDDEV